MSATTVALDVACGGVSTAVVSAILNPTDVIKTRRQIVGFSGASPLDMARAVARADGLKGLWLPGLQATVLRELLYSGCTKGLYPYARDAVAGEEDASLAQRALVVGAAFHLAERQRRVPREHGQPRREVAIWAAQGVGDDVPDQCAAFPQTYVPAT